MKTTVFWIAVFTIGISLWYWFIYPAYLDVNECSLAVKEAIQPVIDERNKTVYSLKADVCQLESQALIELSECYKEKKGTSLIHQLLIWNPSLLFEQQQLRGQHEAQCLDSSPLFIDR